MYQDPELWRSTKEDGVKTRQSHKLNINCCPPRNTATGRGALVPVVDPPHRPILREEHPRRRVCAGCDLRQLRLDIRDAGLWKTKIAEFIRGEEERCRFGAF